MRWPKPWSARELQQLQAWVTLPHCMQTSKKFWERVGFEIGKEVDKNSITMAVLRTPSLLAGDFSLWAQLDAAETPRSDASSS